MKKIILLFQAIVFSIAAFGQSFATDFTVTDCASGSHTLFTELDNGKIVVMVWVMPCAACISNAKAAYDAVQSFSSSNPGKVLYYLIDDVGDNTCTDISSWASTNSIGPTNLTVFSNSGNVIKQSDYYAAAMPHVVVLGGTSHRVYYNKLYGANDGVAITNAIAQAINPTGVNNIVSANNEVSLYPNPVKNKVTINYTIAEQGTVSFEIINTIGAVVQTKQIENQASGFHSLSMDIDNSISSGIYFLKIHSEHLSKTLRFIISK